MIGRAGFLGAALLVFLVLVACAAPDWPQPDEVQLTSYTHPSEDFRVTYISGSTIDESNDSVFFRWRGAPILCVRYVTEQRAGRDLWIGSDPLGDIELGGRAGKKYSYYHDLTHTVSYVVPHKGKYIGLEFRMDGDELNTLQRQILEGFEFTAGG